MKDYCVMPEGLGGASEEAKADEQDVALSDCE